MAPSPIDLSALGFQALVTVVLATVYWGLWRQHREAFFITWAVAWALYALRIGFIAWFLVMGDMFWLFAHQATTGAIALLLLLAALQFARGIAWRPGFLLLGVIAVGWAFVTIYVLGDMAIAGISAAIMLSAVTIWTGIVFWRYYRLHPSIGALVMAITFILWGLHHLDYPLLRAAGESIIYGVFIDVLFIAVAAAGAVFLVLKHERRALEERSAQLEQLTHQLMHAQEDERRRIARELHDQAGQVLTAVKIELDLEGRHRASELVGQALTQVRDLSNLLRPAALDDLGLVPALRRLVEDFERSTRIETHLEVESPPASIQSGLEVVLFRIVQEALTNVARHAEAGHVRVTLADRDGEIRLLISDDGQGAPQQPTPNLGLLGIRERVTALGGTLAIGTAPGAGFRLEARVPAGAAAQPRSWSEKH